MRSLIRWLALVMLVGLAGCAPHPYQYTIEPAKTMALGWSRDEKSGYNFKYVTIDGHKFMLLNEGTSYSFAAVEVK